MRCYGLSTYVTDDFDDGVSLGSYVDGVLLQKSPLQHVPLGRSLGYHRPLYIVFFGVCAPLKFLAQDLARILQNAFDVLGSRLSILIKGS